MNTISQKVIDDAMLAAGNNDLSFLDAVSKADIALWLSVLTILWRFVDLAIKRLDRSSDKADNVIKENWVNQVLEPICIRTVRGFSIKVSDKFYDISQDDLDETTDSWSIKFSQFMDEFCIKRSALETRLRVINSIYPAVFTTVQNRMNELEDVLSSYYVSTTKIENKVNKSEKRNDVQNSIFEVTALVLRDINSITGTKELRVYLGFKPSLVKRCKNHFFPIANPNFTNTVLSQHPNCGSILSYIQRINL